VIDNFADRISFPLTELHLSKLDYLCLSALEQPNFIVVVTDTSVKPNKSLQAVSVAYGWRKDIQVISSHPKLHLGKSQPKMQNYRPFDWELLRLDVDRVIVTTDSLFSAKKGSRPLTSLWSG